MTKHSATRKTPKIDRSWHVDFWLAYLLVELPARRVMLAYGALKEQPLSWGVFLRVFLGVTMLPVFILSWALRTAAYNVVDLIVLLFAILMCPFAIPPLENDEPFDTHMRRLTYPPESHRPLRSILTKIKASTAAKMRRSAQKNDSKKHSKKKKCNTHVGEEQ